MQGEEHGPTWPNQMVGRSFVWWHLILRNYIGHVYMVQRSNPPPPRPWSWSWVSHSTVPLPPVIHFCYVSTQCFHACWHVSHDHIIHIFHAHSAWLKTSRTCVYKKSVVAALDSGVSLGFQGSLKGESYLKVVAEPVPSPSLDPCAKLPNSAHVPFTGLAEATCRSS